MGSVLVGRSEFLSCLERFPLLLNRPQGSIGQPFFCGGWFGGSSRHVKLYLQRERATLPYITWGVGVLVATVPAMKKGTPILEGFFQRSKTSCQRCDSKNGASFAALTSFTWFHAKLASLLCGWSGGLEVCRSPQEPGISKPIQTTERCLNN